MRLTASFKEKLFNVTAMLIGISQLVFIGTRWPQVPNEIPLGFGIAEVNDLYGPKIILWLIPIFNLLIICMIIFLRRGPLLR